MATQAQSAPSTTAGETFAKAPDLIAWHVTQKGTKSYWNKVGASWTHKDGKGVTLQLETVPINGRIVLRTPMEGNAEASEVAR